MSKSIVGSDDLRQYGFNILTGEACRVGARLLVDLDERGARIFRDLMGLPPDCPLASNWNSGSIASVMVPHDTIQAIKVWCLLDSGYQWVIADNEGNAYGFGADEEAQFTETRDLYNRWQKLYRIYYVDRGQPGHGTRATHAFTGRTE